MVMVDAWRASKLGSIPRGSTIYNSKTFDINRVMWAMTLITFSQKDNEYCLPVTIVSIDAIPNEV